MRHDELSKKLEGLWHDSYKSPGYQALRAVVELHKPEQNCFDATCYCKDDCKHCKHKYPCPTIQAIEKELK